MYGCIDKSYLKKTEVNRKRCDWNLIEMQDIRSIRRDDLPLHDLYYKSQSGEFFIDKASCFIAAKQYYIGK